MNVYDFDNTIYNGESLFDFYLFSVKRHPRLIRYLFYILKNYILYKMCRIEFDELREKLSKNAASILKEFDNLNEEVDLFWRKNSKKIKRFYFEKQKPDDVILSASFDFLILSFCQRMGIENVICSELDLNSGEITRLCYRENKLNCFLEVFENAEIDEFYTDSENDIAVIKYARNAYIVKKNKVLKIK